MFILMVKITQDIMAYLPVEGKKGGKVEREADLHMQKQIFTLFSLRINIKSHLKSKHMWCFV